MHDDRTDTVVDDGGPPANGVGGDGSTPIPASGVGGRAADGDAEAREDRRPARHPDPTRYGDWEKGGRCIDF